ncbi:hypothetical protein [Oryzihumus leptocrescens]|uniref:Uncharacterized protein n=1 Tax=Oryzihumus leptocrescens TaxID=297536 RepID=A0A542ZHA8_9MICO|nr:hypothetical protein [Oryzihumus leptocrescens]TQL59714.1 hypothetical protein FB474_1080 [Oryzihumus leptocrescens]
MNYLADGGGGGYPGGQHAEYDFEMIRRLAHSKGAVWTEHAKASHSKVTSTGLSADSFSDIPSCQEFGQVYQAAYDIYVATLAGVQKDVKAYQEKLLAVAQHMEDRDHRAESVFAHFGNDSSTLAVQRNYDAQTHTEEAADASDVVRETRGEQHSGAGQSAPTSADQGDAATVTPAASGSAPTTAPTPKDGQTRVQASADPYASDKPGA